MADNPIGLLAFRNAYDINNLKRRTAIDDPLAADADEAARNQAAASILSATKSPDDTAKANALSLLTGLPPATVDDNIPDVERQVQVAKARKLMGDYPSLGVWASDPRMAALGRDDLDSLGKTAETVKKYDGPVLRAWNGPAPTVGNMIANVGDQFAAMGAGFKSAIPEAINWLQQRRSGMLGFAPWILEDKLNPEGMVRTRAALRHDAAQASAGASLSYPNIQSETGRVAYGAFTSIVQNLPGIAASIISENPAPAVAYAGLSTGSQSYSKYLARGATPGEALAGGFLEGGIESLTEMIPMGYLVSAFGKREMKGFLAEMGKEVLTEIPGEQLATFGQDAVDTAIANPDKTWGQFWGERGVAAGETLGITVLQSLLMGGAGLGVHRIINSQRSAQAEYDGQFLNQLADNAGESLTRKRDPSAWAKFLHLQTEGSAVEKLYIPAEAVASLYQSNNMDWHDDGGWFGFDKSIPDQIDQGLRTGGDVIVNTADYVAHLAGTPAWEALADHVRGRADGLSLAEARSYDEAHADEMEVRGREAAQQSIEQMKSMTPVARVYQDVFDKSRAAGFGVRPARAYAELWSSRYEARAARSPELGDAYQAYQAANVDILRDVPESVKAYSKANHLDVLINAMRRGKAAASDTARRGPSLLEFIAKRGGIEDKGGDLKALGLDQWHRDASFRRKLIAPHTADGQGQLSGLEKGATPNSPERVFEAAIAAGYFPELTGRESEHSGYAAKADLQTLYDAMDREHRGGQPVYSEGHAVEGGKATDAEVRKAADDLRAMLESRGLDPDSATPAEITDAINSYQAEAVRGLEQNPRTDTTAFKAWSGNAPVVTSAEAVTREFKTGEAVAVEAYHGTARPDRIGDQFRADRATAGPMQYFTSDPGLASSYSTSKADTSIDDEEHNYDNWFKVNVGGRTMPLAKSWALLPMEVRAEIRKLAPRVKLDDDTGEHVVLGDEGETRGVGSYDHEIQVAKGNALKALVESWLTSGSLFDQEHRFMDVLRLAGMPMSAVTFDDPHATYSAVIPVWIAMHNPLVTNQVPASLEKALNDAADKEPPSDKSVYSSFSNVWDKSGWSLREWVDQFNSADDRQWIWTRIPDSVTAIMRDHGYDGIIDWSGKGRGTEVHPVYVPFGPTQIKSQFNTGTFDPNDARMLHQTSRGRLDIYANGEHIIRLFEDADLSTLLHESGHLWVEELKNDATADGASDQLKADWASVQKWFADNGHAVGDDGAIPTDAHELWARGMERYFMEGKSPSAGLRSAFDAFRGWLLRIYQLVRRLNSPINKDLRAVMDRLVVTDDAITDQANDIADKALFTSTEQAGMTDAEFAEYQKTVSDTRNEAFDALLYRTMENIRRERTKEWKSERRSVRDGVAESIAKRPEFIALNKMRGRDGDRVPLDRKAIVDEYGSDALALVPRGIPPTVVDSGGVHPDILAEAVGLSSGDDLMQRLMGIQKRENELREAGDKRSAFNEAVDNETDQIMRDRHGDILTDGSIEEEALAAIHSDKRSTVLASELRALARRKGEVPTPWQLAKQWAERTVREGKVSEQASAAALAMHRRNEAKAGRAAEAAILAGDIDEAYRQKQTQLINHARWQAAKAAKDEVDKIVRRLGKLAKAKTLASMDQDYLDRIHDMLEDYDFRPRTQRGVAERDAFAAWVKSRADMGEEIYIPPRLANAQQVNWSQMTYGDLTSLDDVVASIAHLGRRKKQLLVAGEERDFAEMLNEAVAGAAAVPDQKVTSDRNPKRSNIRRVHAELVKVESIADDMDDGNPNGVFNRVLIRGATEAANKKAQLVEDVLKPLSQLYLAMPKAERARHLEKVDIPEFLHPLTGEPTTFTRSQLLAIALNTGNESNLGKMLRGEGWNLATVEGVLARELTENDWKFVEGVWQNVEKLWPDIARTERELTGVVPEKIKPRVVTTPFGQIEGGYYPVVYDPNNPRTPEHIRDASARDAEEFFGQHGRYVSTPKGHTVTRTEAAAPLLYSVEGVLFNHVNRVSTRIAYGRYIRDALKFTRNDKIRSLVRTKLGPELQSQIEPWLRRQVNEAAMNTRDLAGWESALRQFRINATMVGLGFRFTTMQSQLAGLNNSAALIGGKWVATGMAEWLSKRGEARDAVFAASPEMARRAQEFDRDVSAAFRQMQGKTGKLDTVRSMAYWGIGQIDVHMVAIPTWLGAYRKALSEGMNETDAAAYGDKIVRVSQAAGRAKDLSSIQDSNEGWRVATMFYSYFNALYQQQRMAVRATMRGDYRKAAHIAFYTMIASPLASALLVGDWDWPSEKDTASEYLGWVMSHVFFGLWAGIPFLRDAASAGQQVSSGKAPTLKDALDRANNPAIRALVAGGSLMDDFYKGVHDGALPEKWLQHAIETPGYFIGLPTGQVGATTDYLYALATHAQHPKNVTDVVSGVEHGRRKDQK